MREIGWEEKLWQLGHRLDDAWDVLWPWVFVLVIMFVAIGVWKYFYGIHRNGLKGRQNIGQGILKLGAGLVSMIVFLFILVMFAHHFQGEDIPQDRREWERQATESIDVVKTVIFGKPTEVEHMRSALEELTSDRVLNIDQMVLVASMDSFLKHTTLEDSVSVAKANALFTKLAISLGPRIEKEKKPSKDKNDGEEEDEEKNKEGSHPWVDWIFWSGLILFLALIFALSKENKSKYTGILVMVLYLMLYFTLRPWITLGQGFGLFVLINLCQFIIVSILVFLAYRKFMWMLENKQCAVTVDPVSKQPVEFKEGNRFFGLGIVTFVIFVICFLALFSFPLDIIMLGGSLGIRIGMLFMTLIVISVIWGASRHDKVIKYLNDTKINSKVILIPGAILCILSLALPGAWLFCFLTFAMLASWELAAMFQVPIAHKMVPEILSKDRYWNWLYFFVREKDGTLKVRMKNGFHFTAWSAWAPFTRYYIFQEEILEIDKYKVEDKLPTAGRPCRFTLELDDDGEKTGRLIEVLRSEYMEGDEEKSDGFEDLTGPPVEFYITQRFEKFKDTAAFLRRDLTDREAPQELLKRGTQNMLKRLVRRLSVTQALVGGYFTSDRHLFYFAGINYPEGHEKAGEQMPVTFRDAVRHEGMEAIGFFEEDTELSDANPPEDLQKEQIALEVARTKLARVEVEAEQEIAKLGGEGQALAAKIGHVQVALQTGHFGQEAFAGLQAMEFAANDGTIVFPAGFLNQLSGLASRLSATATEAYPVAPTPVIPTLSTPTPDVEGSDDSDSRKD